MFTINIRKFIVLTLRFIKWRIRYPTTADMRLYLFLVIHYTILYSEFIKQRKDVGII